MAFGSCINTGGRCSVQYLLVITLMVLLHDPSVLLRKQIKEQTITAVNRIALSLNSWITWQDNTTLFSDMLSGHPMPVRPVQCHAMNGRRPHREPYDTWRLADYMRWILYQNACIMQSWKPDERPGFSVFEFAVCWIINQDEEFHWSRISLIRALRNPALKRADEWVTACDDGIPLLTNHPKLTSVFVDRCIGVSFQSRGSGADACRKVWQQWEGGQQWLHLTNYSIKWICYFSNVSIFETWRECK